MVINVDKKKEHEIGIFEFEEDENLLEIELVSKKNPPRIKKIGPIRIVLYERDEGINVPHIHLFSMYGNRQVKGETIYTFDSCVSLKEPKYFPHGGLHEDRFTKQQKKQFNSIMSSLSHMFSENEDNKVLTYFEAAKYLWTNIYGDPPNGPIGDQPNYELLEDDVNPNLRKGKLL